MTVRPRGRRLAVGDKDFAARVDPLAIQYIFVRGANAAVQRMVVRRKFADLQLPRLADTPSPAALPRAFARADGRVKMPPRHAAAGRAWV